MKLMDCIKLGFGFYIGYNIASVMDNTFGFINKKKTK